MKRIAVLIVDDDPQILTSLARMTTAMGFDAIRASSAQEAISEIENADILIADLKLNNDTHGGELVLDTWLSRRSGPCCVLTGYADRDKENDLFIRGAENVLGKPIPMAAIQAILNRYRRYVKNDRIRERLLREVEKMKIEIADLRADVMKAQKRAMKLSVGLSIALLTVLGVDASGTTIADLLSSIFQFIF